MQCIPFLYADVNTQWLFPVHSIRLNIFLPPFFSVHWYLGYRWNSIGRGRIVQLIVLLKVYGINKLTLKGVRSHNSALHSLSLSICLAIANIFEYISERKNAIRRNTIKMQCAMNATKQKQNKNSSHRIIFLFIEKQFIYVSPFHIFTFQYHCYSYSSYYKHHHHHQQQHHHYHHWASAIVVVVPPARPSTTHLLLYTIHCTM